MVRAGTLLLGLALISFEAATALVSLLGPAVTEQYRAVYLNHQQRCWMSPAEQAAAAADPYLATLPADAAVAQLDHRTLCMLLPDWPPAPHRTPDGQIYSEGRRVRIMLPVRPGQTIAILTVQGYAPPRVANCAGGIAIEAKPTIDGIAQLPVTVAVGQTVRIAIRLPPAGSDNPRIVRITFDIPQPAWLQPDAESDDPQYLGLVLLQLDRR
jgi:hypothetical protein